VSDDHPPRPNSHEPAVVPEAPQKKRYEKPALTFERVFETTALACGKVQATQGQCRLNRKAS